MSPDTFNVVAVGVGALIVAAAALGTAIATHISNKKSREQTQVIARETADALKLQNAETIKIAAATHEIKVTMDGRMDELLETTRKLANSAGVVVGRAQVHEEIAAAAEAVSSKAIEHVSEAVVERIGEAADKAVGQLKAKG